MLPRSTMEITPSLSISPSHRGSLALTLITLLYQLADLAEIDDAYDPVQIDVGLASQLVVFGPTMSSVIEHP